MDELQTLDIGVDRSLLGDQSLNSWSPESPPLVKIWFSNMLTCFLCFSSRCFGGHMTRLLSDYKGKTHKRHILTWSISTSTKMTKTDLISLGLRCHKPKEPSCQIVVGAPQLQVSCEGSEMGKRQYWHIHISKSPGNFFTTNILNM